MAAVKLKKVVYDERGSLSRSLVGGGEFRFFKELWRSLCDHVIISWHKDAFDSLRPLQKSCLLTAIGFGRYEFPIFRSL